MTSSTGQMRIISQFLCVTRAIEDIFTQSLWMKVLYRLTELDKSIKKGNNCIYDTYFTVWWQKSSFKWTIKTTPLAKYDSFLNFWGTRATEDNLIQSVHIQYLCRVTELNNGIWKGKTAFPTQFFAVWWQKLPIEWTVMMTSTGQMWIIYQFLSVARAIEDNFT